MTNLDGRADLPTDWPIQRIRANGLDFGYLSLGEGPLVLCLHGFPDTAWSFRDLMTRLAAAGFRAVAPFMRGYPPTSIPADGSYSAISLGRDVLALIEHLGVQQAHIVGHDWGAAAAYAAALQRPDRIGRIVAAGLPHPRRFLLGASTEQISASGYMFKFQLPILPERWLRKDNFAWLDAMIARASPDWHPSEDVFKPVRAAFADRKRLKAALGYYRSMPMSVFRPDTWGLMFKAIQVPARVIYGEKDGVILPDSFKGQEHLFAAGYDLAGMPTGHFMHLEDPQGFAERVIDFLKS